MYMTPSYRYSLPSPPMPFDLNNNEDHNHHLFNTNIHQPSSSSSFLSYSTLFNQKQDKGSSYSREPNNLQSDVEVVKFVPSSGSCDYREVRKENGNEEFEAEDNSSMKWMPSKKRIIKRMMEDQRASQPKFEKEKVLCVGTDNSSNNNASNNSNMIVRVCSDCHTTKTPLWRSGPAGPKSLCNACGIRQRKARRALAVAASANGEIHVAAEKPYVKGKKLQIKRKRPKTDECAPPQMKKKGKIRNRCTSFEDLITSLSNNLASHHVFPQDEKEAAILLMALSYGLLHELDSF